MNWLALILIGTISLLCLLVILDAQRIRKGALSGRLTHRPAIHRRAGSPSQERPRPERASDEQIARILLRSQRTITRLPK